MMPRFASDELRAVATTLSFSAYLLQMTWRANHDEINAESEPLAEGRPLYARRCSLMRRRMG